MAEIHTHYVNLGLPRDASPLAIREAYKALVARFHPDRNPGDPRAAEMLEIICASYRVLSDPAKRREHDAWVAHHERAAARQTPVAPREPEVRRSYPATRRAINGRSSGAWAAHFGRHWWRYLGIGVVLVAAAVGKVRELVQGPGPYHGTSALARSGYVRPDAAPNGQPWPAGAGYVRGYQPLHLGGLSSVTVDNSRNDSDAFVKLMAVGGAEAYPVRWFYIPAFSSFTVGDLTAGRYDIRYRDLGTGGLARSEAFDLVEKSTPGGTQYSKLTMTLYKVQNGNMRTYDISESEF